MCICQWESFSLSSWVEAHPLWFLTDENSFLGDGAKGTWPKKVMWFLGETQAPPEDLPHLWQENRTVGPTGGSENSELNYLLWNFNDRLSQTLLVCVCLKFIQKVDTYLNVSLSILRIHFNGCIGKITTSFSKSLSNPVISLRVCNLSLYIFVWLARLRPFWMVVSFRVSTELYNSGSDIKAVLSQFHLDF